jgi:tight adherence protein C
MIEIEWFGLAFLFLAVSGLSFVAVQGLFSRRNRVGERLGSESDLALDSQPEMVLGPLTPALAGQTPVTATGRAALEQELRDAGYYRPTALMEFLAVRAVLTFLPLFIAAALLVLVEPERFPVVIGLGLCAAVLGFSLPRVYINGQARRRWRQIERGLPVAVDLLTLALTAGQNVLSAFQRVSQELKFAYPVLSQELAIVAHQASLRSLEHALRQLAARVRLPEVRTLALILVQSEQLGTDITAALMEFATNFRTTLKQRAEAQANRASFWMVFPTLFCLWIPAAVLLIGPVFYEFWHRRSDSERYLQGGAQKAKEIKERRQVLSGGASAAPGEVEP